MAIRKGQSEGLDKLFTYVVLAIGAVVIIAVFVYFAKQVAPAVGLMSEETLMETEISVAPGEARRFSNLEIKPLGKSKIKYRLELHPSRGEAFAGVVKRGAKLEPANVIGANYVLTTVQGRPVHWGEACPPGKYDVVVENRAQGPLTTKVALKVVYDK
jgi:hypothetical protein